MSEKWERGNDQANRTLSCLECGAGLEGGRGSEGQQARRGEGSWFSAGCALKLSKAAKEKTLSRAAEGC